ncbi:MAG: hypothetical protein OEW39_07825 [Deltaproteobacteria bacterium]|nr:hypothetical protein [Deltaproteobacteria bacterium]
MARCFLAFELTERSRQALQGWFEPFLQGLKAENSRVLHPVPAANWHTTLLFFSDLSEESMGRAWEQMRTWSGEKAWGALEFNWKGLALWPSERRPGLICLEAQVYSAHPPWPILNHLKQPPFNAGQGDHLRTYRPHITLARIRGRGSRSLVQDLKKALAHHAATPLPAIQLDRLSFFLSAKAPGNPIYPRAYTLEL